ncbi:MAG: hypothetical protein H7844_01200 [Nitrospirae bacterium YQR-1]
MPLKSTAAEIASFDVYTEAMQILKEVEIIKKHFKIKTSAEVRDFKTNIQPRNVWQMSYAVYYKLNLLRKKNGLPGLSIPIIEPVINVDPVLVYEQTQRILTEFSIFKRRMGITEKATDRQQYSDKHPIDVFNRLHQVFLELELVTEQTVTPDYTFAQSMIILDDISLMVNELGLNDSTIPPKRLPDATPKEVFDTTYALMEYVQKLQKSVGIETVDFSVFRAEHTKPSDVFNLQLMVISELQTLKAYLKLNIYITPAAKTYKNKIPADVLQLMGWSLLRIQLIKTIK